MAAALILAAGESRRFGGPKQLAQFEGKPLLVRSIEAVTQSKFEEAVVVLGAYAAQIIPAIERIPHVYIVRNTDWHEGRAASIRVGLDAARLLWPSVSGTLLMVCDQPYVNSDLLDNLYDNHRVVPKAIIASEYSSTVGVPMIIPQGYFGELMQLHGDQGAKVVADAHPEQIVRIPFPEGAVDIDSEEDMIAL